MLALISCSNADGALFDCAFAWSAFPHWRQNFAVFSFSVPQWLQYMAPLFVGDCFNDARIVKRRVPEKGNKSGKKIVKACAHSAAVACV